MKKPTEYTVGFQYIECRIKSNKNSLSPQETLHFHVRPTSNQAQQSVHLHVFFKKSYPEYNNSLSKHNILFCVDSSADFK